jgi:hypothetical protein
MKGLIAAVLGIAAVACLAAAATTKTGTSIAADRKATPVAQTAAIRISDIDADLKRSGKLRLEAETRGATRLTFTYRGRTYAGRVVETDDGGREWARTVRTRKGDRSGGRRVAIRVRACSGKKCSSRVSREYLERPGGDDDRDDD